MESMPNGHVVICGHCHTRYKIKHNFDKNKMLGGALAGGLAGAALGGFPGAIIGTSAGALFGSLGTSAMPFDKKEGEGNV